VSRVRSARDNVSPRVPVHAVLTFGRVDEIIQHVIAADVYDDDPLIAPVLTLAH